MANGRSASKRSGSPLFAGSEHSRRSGDESEGESKPKRNRESSEGDVKPAKRSRVDLEDSSWMECRILVNVSKAGGIIGFKGQLIRETEEECHAKLAMSSDSKVGYRVLTIKASIQNILDVIERLFATLTEASSSSHGSAMLRILYHDSITAAVIGRGGQTIAKIREDTAAMINISPDGFEGSTDRLISISGRRENCLVAVHDILKTIKGLAIRGSENPFLGQRVERSVSPPRRRAPEPARPVVLLGQRSRSTTSSRLPPGYPPAYYQHPMYQSHPPVDPWRGHPAYGYPYPYPYGQQGYMPRPAPRETYPSPQSYDQDRQSRRTDDYDPEPRAYDRYYSRDQGRRPEEYDPEAGTRAYIGYYSRSRTEDEDSSARQ
ncbi:hypothetical protein QR680_004469 [Steinernema hermaphroditum]|uniref:K Homology domain-containing protein n=1 Tax=Steinernema hermaphroditum TaxID=289476 RepID=A0AA39HNU6_9BILA|nr:hypothetical protein QR680_004469 [Steinernema hermaphroditum]